MGDGWWTDGLTGPSWDERFGKQHEKTVKQWLNLFGQLNHLYLSTERVETQDSSGCGSQLVAFIFCDKILICKAKNCTRWPKVCGHLNIVHQWGPALMLGDRVWLTVSVPVPPKGVGWVWGQGSVQTSHVLPHQTGKTFSLWMCLWAWGQERDTLLSKPGGPSLLILVLCESFLEAWKGQI